MTIWQLAVPVLVLALSGCNWFHDDRPEPSGLPYHAPGPEKHNVYSSDEAVNAAVSSISLRMAVSSLGPFRVVPTRNKTSALGFRVIDSLARMRLSRPDSSSILRLEDRIPADGVWSLVLFHPDGGEFLRKSFKLKDGGNERK